MEGCAGSSVLTLTERATPVSLSVSESESEIKGGGSSSISSRGAVPSTMAAAASLAASMRPSLSADTRKPDRCERRLLGWCLVGKLV
jgi:hypothetical protein